MESFEDFSYDFEVLKDQIGELYGHQLYMSAELLSHFYLSRQENLVKMKKNSRKNGDFDVVETLILLGETMFKQREYKRAYRYFQDALKEKREISRKLKFSFLVNSSPAANTNSENATLAYQITSVDASVLQKMAEIKVILGEFKAAHHLLESIPTQLRNVTVTFILGKLCEKNGMERQAVKHYYDVLKQLPFAVEVALSLVSLGRDVNEIVDFLVNEKAYSSVLWLKSYLVAHRHYCRNEFGDALTIYKQLDSNLFTDNLAITLKMAKCNAALGDVDVACEQFAKSRLIDSTNITDMDTYAACLRTSAKLSSSSTTTTTTTTTAATAVAATAATGAGANFQKNFNLLNVLAQDMIQLSGERPETWTCISIYSIIKGDKKDAMNFIEKALQFDSTNFMAHAVKGSLLLASGKKEAALASFRRSYLLQKDIVVYEGLIESYIQCGRIKEAMEIAKELMIKIPNNARAMTMMGLVFLEGSNSDSLQNAKKWLENALELDNRYIPAMIAMVKYYKVENKLEEAMKFLGEHIRRLSNDVLFAEMGELLVSSGKNAEASFYYQKALTINPRCENALKGFAKIDKILKATAADVDADADGVDLSAHLNDEEEPLEITEHHHHLDDSMDAQYI